MRSLGSGSVSGPMAKASGGSFCRKSSTAAAPGFGVRSAMSGFGLFEDPADVVRSTVNNRQSDDARHLVGMVALGALDDLWQKATPRAKRNPSLRPVVDLTLPSVHRSNGSEIVPGSAEPLRDQLVSEFGEPIRVRRRDDDLADLMHRRTPSAWRPIP